MIVPLSELENETIKSIAEAFVLREGTDYGEVEVSFEEKVDHVIERLNSGEAVLVYSQLHETVDIRPAESYDPSAEEPTE
ncbi:YheU family protein [Salinimonas sp. HHU 13199]|uniref:YheU family protein n=1 Tax=Salinimonas profundi TaxID=2729140 RepID=A0ABR8LHG3_9ALTE|nr:YheU family protein [Salinimonas profundi]MBD3585691.1 YheU family protein [Salinimonas profundi]